MAENLGASFSIDTTDLKAGLAQANRLIRESESEFKAAAAGLDDWTASEEGVSAKIKTLNSVTDIQRKKVNALQSEYDRLIAEGLDPTSASATELRTKINNETAALNKNETELKNQKKALEELADATEEAGDAAEDTADSFEGFEGAGKVAVGAIAAFSAACVAAVGSLLNLAESTMEYRKEMAKLNSAFDAAGLGADLAQKSYDDLYSVLGDTGKATEASMLIAQIAKDEQDLDKWNRILVGTFAQYGDAIPTEGLAEAISASSAMSSVQGVLADALEWQGVNLDDFNEKLGSMSTEEERAALIQETLTGLYGESADAYRENNAELLAANDATNELTKKQAELGESIQPISTKFTELKTKALQWLIDTGLPASQKGFAWIKDNLPTIAIVVGGLTTAIVAQNAATKIKKITDMAAAQGVSVLTLAQKGLNAAFKANPIGLVITAVTLLTSAFTYLWQNCEGFRNFWKGLWSGMKTVASAAKDGIVGIFTGIANILKTPFNAVISLINGAIKAINKISVKIPDWVPEFGGKKLGFNIPKIPKLAKGGVVDKATLAMIGESGKEAVLPLERNKGWMKELAKEIASAQSGGIVVNNNFKQAYTSQREKYKAQQELLATVRLAKAGG